MLFYCGSYSSSIDDMGIFIGEIEVHSGKVRFLNSIKAGINPSFLLLNSERTKLYAVNEIAVPNDTAKVTAFNLSNDGKKVTFCSQIEIPGLAPCYITLDESQGYLYTADYISGSVSRVKIDEQGQLVESDLVIQHEGRGSDPIRQETPHMHWVGTEYLQDNALSELFCIDLGLDLLEIYSVNSEISRFLKNNSYHFSSGSGPRMMIKGNHGIYYAVEELGLNISVIMRKDQSLEQIQRLSIFPSNIDQDYKNNVENTASHILLNSTKNRLYVSNRGIDCISYFSVDVHSGYLTLIGYVQTRVKFPRFFAISPDDHYLIVVGQLSDNLEVFKIQEDGTPFSLEIIEGIISPTCVLFYEAS